MLLNHMDERRKIVIPIGNNPDSESEQTFFDTQARKDARPVVPLSGTSTNAPAATGRRSRKLILLVVVVVAAVAAAGTAGIYAYIARDGSKGGPQTAVQPVAGKTLSMLPWTHTPEDPAAEVNAESTEQAKDATADGTQARNDRAANTGDSKKASKQQKRGKSNKNNQDDDPDNPVKRTQDELHRIRDIFEGPP